MKRSSIVTPLLIIIILLSACGKKESNSDVNNSETTHLTSQETLPNPDEESSSLNDEIKVDDGIPGQSEEFEYTQVVFKPGTPVSVFSENDILYLGVEVAGSEREIAEGIRQWQIDNMIYASPDSGFIDASDPIRWNYFLPGIWPSKDIIYEHVKDGKVYGVCHDFAIIYCSIANYFGLETRVMNTRSKPSDGSSQPAMPGMHPDEYNRNRIQLSKYGLNYSYDAISSVAEETPTHYWAEVYLDGEWVIMDGSQTSTGGNTETEFKATKDYEITDWMSRDKTAILNRFAPVSGTDDLGQVGRATSIGEIMQGYALAPYLNDAENAVTFIGGAGRFSPGEIREMNEDKTAYETCSGKKLYLVSYLICDGDRLQGQEWLDRYAEICGEELDVNCGYYIISGN